LDLGAGCHNDVPVRCLLDEFGDGVSPSVDCWFVRVFDLVDIVEEDELRAVVWSATVDAAFVVADCARELLVGLELIEWVRVEWEIEELLGGVAGVDSVLDELVEERGFADAAPADQCEDGLIFELASGRVRSGEMVEIAFLPCRKVESVGTVVPPGVVLVEGLD